MTQTGSQALGGKTTASAYLQAYNSNTLNAGKSSLANLLKNIGVYSGSTESIRASEEALIQQALANIDASPELSQKTLASIGLADQSQRDAFGSQVFGPASGTTPASRAAAAAAGDPTLGYKDPIGAKMATAVSTGNNKVQVSTDQVNALEAAGEEVPQYAQDAIAQGRATPATQVQSQQPNPATGQNGAPGVDATLGQNGQAPLQVGGRFGTQQFGRVGDDVFEIMSDGTRRSVTAAEFNQKLKAQGLNLDVLPQLDPNSNVADIPGGAGDATKSTSQFVADYQGIITELGLTDLKKQIESVTEEYEDLKAKKLDEISDVNEDPWLTEGTRVNRIRSIENRYEGKESNLTAKLELFNTLHEQGVAEAKFLASGMQEDRNKMLEYALKMAEAENDLGLEAGIIGEYQLAVRQGYEGSFRDYQNEDANRKQSIARAGVANGDFGLSTSQANLFNSIVGQYNRSPLVLASDRTPVLRAAIDAINADPSNAAKQLNLSYAYIQALDTYQSAVREGELGNLNSIDSKIGGLQNSIQQIQNGQIVRPEVAKQIAAAANSIVATISQAAQAKASSFRSQASVVGLGPVWDSYIGGSQPSYNSTDSGDGERLTPGTTFTQDNTIYLVGSDGDPNNATPIGSAR